MEVKSANERKRKRIQLERLIESLIEIEEYELCIQLRDMIERLKETKDIVVPRTIEECDEEFVKLLKSLE